MSPRSEPMVEVRESIPLTGKGPENLLGMLRKILSDNPYTQEFTCRIGQPIEIVKMVPESQAPPTLRLHDAVRAQHMEEPTVEGTPLEVLWKMFTAVEDEGLEVSHVLVGDKFKFQEWLGVRISHKSMRVFGVRMVVVPEIPKDTFLVVGSTRRDAEAENIRYSLKGTLP
jgi:hypothetical protein